MFSVSLSSEVGFFDLRDEWELLLKETEDLDFFSTWEWNYSWWKNFKQNKRLFLITFCDSNNNLVGIFPGCIVNYKYLGFLKIDVLQFIGRGIEKQKSIGEYSNFLDVIAHKEYKPAIYDALLTYLKSHKDFDVIYFDVLKATSSFFLFLKNNIEDYYKAFRFEKGPRVYYESLPENLDNYLKILSSKFRSNIRRHVRKWEANHGEKLRVVKDRDSVTDFFDNFFKLVQTRHQKNVSTERRAFLQEVANYSLEKNRFYGIYMKVDDRYAAVASNYLYDNKGYGYQHAINPQFSKSGPGTVLIYYMFENLIEKKIGHFEFLQAKEYIKQWGKNYRYLYDVYLGTGTMRSKLYLTVYSSIENTKSLLKRIIRRTDRISQG